MKTRFSMVLYLCLIGAAAFLSVGYAVAGNGLGILFILALAVCWLLIRKFFWPWLNTMLLAGYICAAAGGILIGILPHLLIAGSGFALAAWELASGTSEQSSDLDNPPDTKFQRTLLILLATSIGLGLVSAELLLFMRVQIPFIGIMVASLLVMFSLYMFTKTFQSK